MGLSNIPDSLKDQLNENYKGGPSTYPRELAILFDDTFEARPLNLPGIGMFEFKNTEVGYHLVRRPMGPNPDLTRYMQMKIAGYRNATLEDVNPLVNAVSADGTEVTVGQDLILMCAPLRIHYGALKAHAQRAIQMTNPRSAFAQTQMKSGNYGDQATLNATRTELLDDTRMADFESRANSGNAVKEGDPNWNAILEGSKKSKGAR